MAGTLDHLHSRRLGVVALVSVCRIHFSVSTTMNTMIESPKGANESLAFNSVVQGPGRSLGLTTHRTSNPMLASIGFVEGEPFEPAESSELVRSRSSNEKSAVATLGGGPRPHRDHMTTKK